MIGFRNVVKRNVFNDDGVAIDSYNINFFANNPAAVMLISSSTVRT